MKILRDLFFIALTSTFSVEVEAQKQLCATVPGGVPQDVFFGMALKDFEQNRDMSQIEVDKSQSFRSVYVQYNPAPAIKALIYYFDSEEKHQPLYEIMVMYESNEEAQRQARQLYGDPNHLNSSNQKMEEWRLSIPGTPAIWSWVYKERLVIVGKIPGSEWFDEWDQN